MSDELFDLPESRPPRLAELRAAYDAACFALDEFDGEPGSSEHDRLGDLADDAFEALRAEERRVAGK